MSEIKTEPNEVVVTNTPAVQGAIEQMQQTATIAMKESDRAPALAPAPADGAAPAGNQTNAAPRDAFTENLVVLDKALAEETIDQWFEEFFALPKLNTVERGEWKPIERDRVFQAVRTLKKRLSIT